MNKHIMQAMFTTDVIIHKTSLPNSLGDVTTPATIAAKAYVVDKEQLVTGQGGVQEISSRQVYLTPEVIEQVKITDKVTCLDVKQVRIIERQVFRGPRGVVHIGVLYLP